MTTERGAAEAFADDESVVFPVLQSCVRTMILQSSGRFCRLWGIYVESEKFSLRYSALRRTGDNPRVDSAARGAEGEDLGLHGALRVRTSVVPAALRVRISVVPEALRVRTSVKPFWTSR